MGKHKPSQQFVDKAAQWVPNQQMDFLDACGARTRHHHAHITEFAQAAAVATRKPDREQPPSAFAASTAATTLGLVPEVLIAINASPAMPNASTCRANTRA